MFGRPENILDVQKLNVQKSFWTCKQKLSGRPNFILDVQKIYCVQHCRCCRQSILLLLQGFCPGRHLNKTIVKQMAISILYPHRKFWRSLHRANFLEISNGRKTARMAPILTIFGPNRSPRRNLFFEKFSNERRRHRGIVVVVIVAVVAVVGGFWVACIKGTSLQIRRPGSRT